MEAKNQGSSPAAPASDLDLADLLANAISYVRRFFWLLAITTAIGIVGAYVLYKISPKYHPARALFQSAVLNNHEEDEILSNWEELLNKPGYPQLAKMLNCPVEIISAVRSMDVELVITPYTDAGVSSFAIEIQTKDVNNLPAVQKAIVYGLENSPFTARKIALRKQDLQQQIDKAEQEVNKLDSSSRYIQSFAHGAEKGGPQLIVDIGKASEERVKIQEQLSEYREKLAFASGVQVVQDFMASGKVKPSGAIFLLTGMVGGFFLGYLISLWRLAMARYRKRESH